VKLQTWLLSDITGLNSGRPRIVAAVNRLIKSSWGVWS